jgi:serine protease
VITVSAVASDYSSAWYSNYGASSTSIELAGMGGDHDLDSNVDGEGDDVWSLSFRDRGNSLYYGLSGTSMAASQVSGVIALMKGVWPAMTTADLMALLPEITVDLGEEGPDPLFGFGLINAAKAVAVAREHGQPGATLPATLRSSSLGLDFGYAFDRLPLELSYFGSAPLQLGDVEVGAPWLHIEPGGLGVNTVSVDREMAKGQQASSELRWLSSAGELVVPVRLGLDFPVPGEVGSLEVALLDADTAAVVARVTTSRSENYAFAFDDLTPGAYRVVVVDDLSGRGLDAQFGALRAQSPLGSGVLCIELERADCRSDLDPADVHPSLAVVADLAIASP